MGGKRKTKKEKDAKMKQRKEELKIARQKLAELKKKFGSKRNHSLPSSNRGLVKFDWKNIDLLVPLKENQVYAKKRIKAKRSTWTPLNKENGQDPEFSSGMLIDIPMGEGKTLIALDTIVDFLKRYGGAPKSQMENKGIIIICTSVDIRNQWCEEILNKTNIPTEYCTFLWSETSKFPKLPTGNRPYIVLTTYRIIMLAGEKEETSPAFERNKWKLIISDEAHIYRNPRTRTALGMIRLILGMKPKVALKLRMMKRTIKRSKKARENKKSANQEDNAEEDEEPEEEEDDGVTKRGSVNFTDQLITDESEGSPDSFRYVSYILVHQLFLTSYRMPLSGTFLVNSIRDLFIHSWLMNEAVICKYQHQETIETKHEEEEEEEDNDDVHPQIHQFNSERWWKEKILFISKESTAQKRSIDDQKNAETLFWEFKEYFCVTTEESKNSKMLGLPPVTMEKVHCDLDPESPQGKAAKVVVELYRGLYTNYEKLKKLRETRNNKKASKKLAKALDILRKSIILLLQFQTMIMLHPACIRGEMSRPTNQKIPKSCQNLLESFKVANLTDELSYKIPSVKIIKLFEIIKKIKTERPGEKIIVFSQYRCFLAILYYHLTRRQKASIDPALLPFGLKVKVSRYYGGLGRDIKSSELLSFQEGDSEVLLANIKSGGVGFNFTCANNVIFCEPPLTDTDHSQAMKRVDRIGQTRKVFVYNLFIINSVDMIRMGYCTKKREFARQFKKLGGVGSVNRGGLQKTLITDENMREMYRMFCGMPSTSSMGSRRNKRKSDDDEEEDADYEKDTENSQKEEEEDDDEDQEFEQDLTEEQKNTIAKVQDILISRYTKNMDDDDDDEPEEETREDDSDNDEDGEAVFYGSEDEEDHEYDNTKEESDKEEVERNEEDNEDEAKEEIVQPRKIAKTKQYRKDTTSDEDEEEEENVPTKRQKFQCDKKEDLLPEQFVEEIEYDLF